MTRKAKSNRVGKKVNKQVKDLVKSIVNQPVERKYFDQSLSGGITCTGGMTNISDVTRGVEVTQRIGNQITLKELQMRLYFDLNPNVETTAIRYLIVLDKQGYNAPVISDVLESGLLGGSYTSICPLYWDYMRRFRVLRDEVVTLVKGGSNQCVQRNFTINLKGIKSYHIGASTTFANQIYLVQVGNETNVLDISTMMYHSRLIYTDE